MTDGYRKGLILTGSGVLLISPDAAFIRAIDAPALDLLFWRGAMLALVMGLVIVVREHRDFRAFWSRFNWAVIPAALCTAPVTIRRYLWLESNVDCGVIIAILLVVSRATEALTAVVCSALLTISIL